MKLKRAFTLLEILVIVAIIGVIAAILFPVLGKARENARRTSCQSNMKQVGLGLKMYAQDHGNAFPKALFEEGLPRGWSDAIFPYT